MRARDGIRRNGGTGLLVAFVIAALAASLAGCSNTGRVVAGKVAGDVGSEVRALPTAGGAAWMSKARLPPVPPAQVQNLAATAQNSAIALIAPYVDDLTVREARYAVRAACIANDLVVLQEASSWDSAAVQALWSFGGQATLRFRVADLAKDMAEARSSMDWARKVGVFVLCETV